MLLYVGRRKQKRRRSRRLRWTFRVILMLIVASPIGAGLVVGHHLSSQVTHVRVFEGLRNRPARVTTGSAAHAMNILVMGTDRRSVVPTTGGDAKASAWIPGAQRTDTMMVVHIDADRKGAFVVSIPRDSWVDVPGYGKAKINAGFSWGGPTLAVATVEQLTHVRIDHIALVDWDGFKAITDALGGVDVTVPETVHDSSNHVTWTAGPHHLRGASALTYVRQRYGLPGGDFDRVRRQQAFFRGLAESAMQSGKATNPWQVYRLVDLLTKHLTVDDGWSGRDLVTLALSLRHLKEQNVRYLTAPVSGTGREGSQSVVYLAPRSGATLWAAVRKDRMGEWAADHPEELTGAVVR